MRVDPRYVPPEIDGYVNWSNFSRDDEGRLIPLDELGRRYCAIATAERLRVPEDAVRVELFTPDDGYDCTTWTVYVKAEHAHAVSEAKRNLADLMRTLRMMAEFDNKGAA